MIKRKKIKKPKKSKKDIHIQINLDNNIVIGYAPINLITEYAIIKNTPEMSEETFPLNHSFSLYEKILEKSPLPIPSIKKFEKSEIKFDNNYILRENLKEKDIIPAIYTENEEEVKYLEKSLEKYVDKSFDRSYEKSFDKSILSLNESQNLSQSNNLSLSYNETSFNASRNSIDGSKGKVIMQQLHRIFSGSISINPEIEEEKNSESSDKKEENKKT